MELKKTLKKYENIIYPLLSLTGFVAVWAIVSACVGIEMILPSPIVSLKNLAALLAKTAFWQAIGGTLWRTLLSFALSYVFAIIFAVLSAGSKVLHRLLEPIITILRATPTMSIILLAIIWLKSETSPLLIGFLIVFPMCYTAVYEALINVDDRLLNMAKVYNVPKRVVVKKLYIPYIAPTLFSSAKSNISLSVKVIIAAEVLAQTAKSMGNSMQLSKIYLDTADLLAWSVAAVALSYILEGVVSLIKRLCVRW